MANALTISIPEDLFPEVFREASFCGESADSYIERAIRNAVAGDIATRQWMQEVEPLPGGADDQGNDIPPADREALERSVQPDIERIERLTQPDLESLEKLAPPPTPENQLTDAQKIQILWNALSPRAGSDYHFSYVDTLNERLSEVERKLYCTG